MKRFLIFAVILLLLITGVYVLAFYEGYYLRLDQAAPLSVPYATEGKQLMALQPEGGYAPITLRGVDLVSSLPGKYASDYAPDEETYLRWLTKIGEMGANTVRVTTVMDDDFYNAFYTYNSTAAQPIYLIQGIQISDEANYGEKDAYHESIQGALTEDGRMAVDVIHGRRLRSQSNIPGGGRYIKDVSPWVVGYLVGHDWIADLIVYTDHSIIRDAEYEGTYLSAAPEATAFEAMLAEVMDNILVYEASKYHTQRTIGFASAPDVDFLEFTEISARQYDKYAHLNPEHVTGTEALESGYFAAYRLFDYCDDFLQHMTPEQKQALAPILSRVDASRSYGGYLDLLGEYHSMPVIAAGYGFSTARGATTEKYPPLNEAQQGERLVTVWKDAMDAGWSGVVISTWQDQWERRTWNTAFATDISNNVYWHDLQTDGQGYGLMAFVPGEEPVCTVDGDASEWDGDSPVLEAEGKQLYLRQDQEGLYLLIQGEGVSAESSLYVPVDMLEGIGSRFCAEPSLSFSTGAEFIVCLKGADNSCILVQDRYHAMRENFLYELQKLDPFIRVPDEDSIEFGVVSMIVSKQVPADQLIEKNIYQLQQLIPYTVWETGRLHHGNGDPSGQNFDSLADFCYGNNCVELRIPWQLLNVADPSDMQIHKDYYENYGVLLQKTDSIQMGLGSGESEISMKSVPLEKLGPAMVWKERLKQSYSIVQQAWS